MTWMNRVLITFTMLLGSFGMAGCASPYYSNQSLPVAGGGWGKGLLGTWESNDRVDGERLTVAVYPLAGSACLLKLVAFDPKNQYIATEIVEAWPTRVGNYRFLSCKLFSPGLLPQSGRRFIKSALRSAIRSDRRQAHFLQSMAASARRDGMASLYFFVRIDSLRKNRVAARLFARKTATPNASYPFGHFFKSAKQLAGYIQISKRLRGGRGRALLFHRVRPESLMPRGFFVMY